MVALGDVAGKGSPAALLMALLLAMLRTLVDEGFHGATLMERLYAQICNHAPPSRFVTLFLATFEPRSGELLYVNAGQTPPMLRRNGGRYEALSQGGMALGMFEQARYEEGRAQLAAGEVLVMYSDGITEAENPEGHPFDEAGLQRVVESPWGSAKELGWAAFEAVERHSRERRLLDDLTVLVLRRLPPLPGMPVAAASAVGV
jgi:sigma-B regulation protein RsbU (phosphoserine phosphatase)